MRFAACHPCMCSCLTCLHCMRRFRHANSPRAGATRGDPEPGSKLGAATFPTSHHSFTLLHTCPPRLPHANCLPFAPHRTPCRPSCTPHRRTACAPQSHNVCPPRLPHIFRSIQGRRGVGRGSKRTGAHTFCGAGFHSVGMCHLGAAGGTASDRHMPRTAFSFSLDAFWLGACPQARFACPHAMFPPQRTHATSPHQHSALSLSNPSSQASQLMHASSCMHNTHFEHAMSHALLAWV